MEIIAGAANTGELAKHPFSTGIPILFPWPGRIARASFEWKGRRFSVPVGEPARGHALHGLIYNCAFRVTQRGPYYFRSELDSAEHPELAALWPWPFRLELEYEVGNGLRLAATVHNTAKAPMPFGFGAHPYFHAPLSPRSRRAAMRLTLDSRNRWILDDSLIPLGRKAPVEGKCDFRSGRELGDESYDDAFQGPEPDASGTVRARLVDGQAKVAIEVGADLSFTHWVIYAPADRPVVSIEPYTCAPDAFNLDARGIEAGTRELAPGASWRGAIEIRVVSAP